MNGRAQRSACWPRIVSRPDPDLSAHLVGLLERREVFRVDYQNVTGQISSYELHPLQILAYHGNW